MCGLFGFIGNDPASFSWDKFNVLGWFNDSRGGDACGRVVGNLCQHGVDSLKTYKEFAMATKNPSVGITENVILGHCRKASSGGKNDIYAQPIIVYKKDLNAKMIKDPIMKAGIKSLKKDDIVFSGIHNGTIDNYLELAPKYGIPTVDHNDSKVLLNILFYGNYKVLTQYIGTAALVFHNHILNRTFIFKGSSKSYSSSAFDSEERPLFSWSINSNMYFSSIEDSLLFIGAIKNEMTSIKCNVLYTFQDGNLMKETEFDRKTMLQNESVSTPATPYKGKNYNYYNHRDDYNNAWDNGQKNLPGGFPVIKRPLDDFTRSFIVCSNSRRIQAEIFNRFYANKSLRRAIYNKSRYWMNGCLMHGVYVLNSVGIVPNKNVRDIAALGLYYFIEGIMMDNQTSYNSAMELHVEFIKDILVGKGGTSYKEQKFTESIAKYSRYPVASLTRTDGGQDCFSNVPSSNVVTNVIIKYYTGTYNPIFSNRSYRFQSGDLQSITEELDGDKRAIHDEDNMAQYRDYLVKCEEESRTDNPRMSFVKGLTLLGDDDLKNTFSPFQNYIIWDTVLSDADQNLKLMLAHYIRDFNEDMNNKCAFCHNDKESVLQKCITCSALTEANENLIKEINYDFE